MAEIGIGSKLVDEAGVTMGDIVDSVRKVADIMSEITAASRAQTGGIESIGQAIERIHGMTQQNSALVEQASAAAESLREQTDHLSEVLSVFKLDVQPVTMPAAGNVAPASTRKVVALRPAQAGRTLLTERLS